MDKTKIIFLDVDGVLNRLGTPTEGRTTTTWNGFIGMEPELVQRFNTLVKELGVGVVLSSTWRLSKTWREDMKGNGLDMEFIDRTKDLYNAGKTARLPRGAEIQEWLDRHPEVERYAIIDDDSDMLPEQPFFQTNYAFGLTEDIAQSIKKHFNG